MVTPAGLAAALDAWRQALGTAHVRTATDDGQSEGLRTFGRPAHVAATLRPGSPDDVSAALAIASRHGVPVHPVSRGANWGLGSRAPLADGGVVIDLGRMAAITRLDARSGIVHVEAGVTFRDLHAWLGEHAPDYFLPTIGGPVTASVLANALDRGDAIFCDRWSSVSDFDVVLADGTRMATGHPAFSPLAGRGIAPAGGMVEGLFSQSNLGIVTGAWLRLQPTPDSLSGWIVDIGARERLPAFIDAWRDLQREGTIPDRSLTLWNGIKRLAKTSRRADHAPDRIAGAQLDDWHCSGFLAGETADILGLRDRRFHARIAPLARRLSHHPIRTGGSWQPHGADIFATPKQANLRTAYWREDAAPALDAMDPDRDGCGMIWLCLALPFEGHAILDLATLCRERLARDDIDLNLGIEAASFRTALAYVTISYRRGADADTAALAAYEDVLALCGAAGAAPYRLANGAPLPAGLAGETRTAMLRRIRDSLDPAGILSPGRAGV